MARSRCSPPSPGRLRRRSRNRGLRNGITLLEVLIATAILAVSLAALGRRGFVAIHAAESGQKQLEGTLIARHVLDAIQAGSLVPTPSETIWQDGTEWRWWTTRRPGPETGLTILEVFVRHEADRSDEPQVVLTQLVRDTVLSRPSTRATSTAL